MTDYPTAAPTDPRVVSLEELHDVSYWTNRLGCSGAELRMAVAAVGTSPEEVAEFIGKGNLLTGNEKSGG